MHHNRKPFLTVVVEEAGTLPTLLGLCAGYELGQWRSKQFAGFLIRQLLEFVYPPEEWDAISSGTGIEMAARAAHSVYNSDKYGKRGEIGELILFSVLRTHFKSLPVISKMYFKSSANDTVKGFDAVHFVEAPNEIQLWLGEVKFYKSANAAIRDVVSELHDHIAANYLKEEFMWISNKMQGSSESHDKIREILDENSSLDDVFSALHIPVLITYESKSVSTSNNFDDIYKNSVKDEIKRHYSKFDFTSSFEDITLHLIFIPLGKKEELQQSFHQRLKMLQEV